MYLFELDEMDFVRAAIANAKAENMTLDDLEACAEHAADVDDFDYAVNLLAQMQVSDNG